MRISSIKSVIILSRRVCTQSKNKLVLNHWKRCGDWNMVNDACARLHGVGRALTVRTHQVFAKLQRKFSLHNRVKKHKKEVQILCVCFIISHFCAHLIALTQFTNPLPPSPSTLPAPFVRGSFCALGAHGLSCVYFLIFQLSGLWFARTFGAINFS